MTRKQEEQAIRHGIDTATSLDPAARYAAYLALRSVAFHLELADIHKDLDARLKALRHLDEV